MKRLIWILKQIALAPFALLCLLFCAVAALFYGIIYLAEASERRTQIAA